MADCSQNSCRKTSSGERSLGDRYRRHHPDFSAAPLCQGLLSSLFRSLFKQLFLSVFLSLEVHFLSLDSREQKFLSCKRDSPWRKRIYEHLTILAWLCSLYSPNGRYVCSQVWHMHLEKVRQCSRSSNSHRLFVPSLVLHPVKHRPHQDKGDIIIHRQIHSMDDHIRAFCRKFYSSTLHMLAIYIHFWMRVLQTEAHPQFWNYSICIYLTSYDLWILRKFFRYDRVPPDTCSKNSSRTSDI